MSVPMSGLVAWFKADAGVTKDGSDRVSAWADQSGNGRDAVQATAAKQPLWVDGVPNGKPILRFEGGAGNREDFLIFSTYDPDGLGGMTIVLVSACTLDIDIPHPYPQRAAIFWDETASWGTVHLSPFQKYIYMRFGTGVIQPVPVKYTHPSSIVDDFKIYVSKMIGREDYLYLNGTLVLNNTKPAGQTTIGNCKDSGDIGRGWDDPSCAEPYTYFPGEIAEILIYDRALSDSERNAVELYLNNKYFVPATERDGRNSRTESLVSRWDMSVINPPDLGWRDLQNDGTGVGLTAADIVNGIGGGWATKYDGAAKYTTFVRGLVDEPSVFSVATWIRADDLTVLDGTYGAGIVHSNTGESVGDWMILVDVNGKLKFGVWENAGADINGLGATPVGTIVVGEWYHIVCVWDGTNKHIFVDTVEKALVGETTGSGWGTAHEIGRLAAGAGYYWKGCVDDVHVHDSVITQLQLSDLRVASVEGRT